MAVLSRIVACFDLSYFMLYFCLSGNLNQGVIVMRGGYREGSGRKSIGVTKKVSLTLPEEVWDVLMRLQDKHGQSQSELLRNLVFHSLGYFSEEFQSKPGGNPN